ncbi:carbamoyl-phosphate synthase large subunit [Streptomyces bathyalis]|uniref:Carbamoyl-phosphate synthase large subunit n=1 Tax=Streptomyces bathyalis TaxID=2710756 RepID=A0A7T1WU47_9ACTN|nr:carboxyl transferase domain-containing protein [Streptomyces bathyalis]QPP07510.1 carbamoyl-phosphate synthase large subunit [Streptomyces bathyalis]
MEPAAVLVANRGEAAVRVLRGAAEAGMRTVAVHASDDAGSLHVRLADEAFALKRSGPAAYLDIDGLLDVAERAECRFVHPGWGFLSERADFARRCSERGVTFVGPRPEVLDLLGDKARARELASDSGVPVLPGTTRPTTLGEARAFLDEQGRDGAVMIKALSGGGGRGMREVRGGDGSADRLDEAWERCASEARHAFGRGELYVERLLTGARHIEVQIAGDDNGAVVHLWERDCSVQRRNQKLIETAPAPSLDGGTRDRLLDASLRMARAAGYSGLGTFEFLVEGGEFFFLEANPRLQVEHTVTEEITGLDLVAVQLALAGGESLAGLGLGSAPAPRGYAIQARVSAESSGKLTRFAPPHGPGVRVDTGVAEGHETGTAYDPLLAKVVVRAPRFTAAAERARRGLAQFHIEGVRTSVPLLRSLLDEPGFLTGGIDTGFADRHASGAAPDTDVSTNAADDAGADDAGSDGAAAARAPMSGTVISLDASAGDAVRAGQQLAVLEAMKMEHVVRAATAGTVLAVPVAVGDTLAEGQPVVLLDPAGTGDDGPVREQEIDLDLVRDDLAEVIGRHRVGQDAERPAAVASRHDRGRRTARENLADLCDEGSFTEYGALALAAQRRRRGLDDLIANTPADGMVAGTCTVNADLFGPRRADCVALSYDYTVLAGTQGHMNHRKTDRLLETAERRRAPVVLFAEGGGGRPGDTDTTAVAGLDLGTFRQMGRLSGLVPLVGVASGYCFAGNAALLGCCDVVIATPESSIGMGGPAMIEGGGLGRYRPEEVGPLDVQVAGGVVDITAADDADAVRLARRYLAYFQGPLSDWEAPDQRLLRHVVPENRRRAYEIRDAIESLADTGSVLELRRGFGAGAVTALIRIEGRPMGLIASNPAHLGGAIDSDAADKAARFLQLCDAFGLPVVSLCDTPGFMVGPDSERTATVRHFSRLFVTGANLSVPVCALILRKAYGLGAMAMLGGSTRAPVATGAWPSGEIGAMGLEGAVRLGYRRELEAIADPEARERAFQDRVDELYANGKALNAATVLEIDDVIDPADSRSWITAAFRDHADGAPWDGKRRPYVDTW